MEAPHRDGSAAASMAWVHYVEHNDKDAACNYNWAAAEANRQAAVAAAAWAAREGHPAGATAVAASYDGCDFENPW